MKNKSGASLIAVVIAMAIVLVLGLGALYVSRNNYKMKVLDKESNDNFYSAESIINDVTTGLQKVMSDVYSESYTKVMANYNNFSAPSEMTSSFNTEFVVGLVEKLNDKSSLGMVSKSVTGTVKYLYDTNLIRSFVNAPKYSGYTWTIDFTDSNALTVHDNVLDTISDGVVLRNIFVTFKNKKGYYNEIRTDIKITVPDLGFSRISAMPNISDFAIIANEALKINESKGIDINGNLYCGPASSGNSIRIMKNGFLDAKNVTLLVSNGVTDIGESGTIYAGETGVTNTALWTKNILFGKNSSGYLIGRTYVQDDTTIQGDNTDVNISGQYFGFTNNPLRASESSAIIINGKNTKLNISGLNSLLLAGTSFIGTSSEKYTGKVNEDIIMGDSVAIKSNQLAYLVPTECEDIVSNPMSYAQYTALTSETGWEKRVVETNISSINRTIASYGEVAIAPVFSTKDNGTVYLYLKFANPESASRYSIDIMNSNSTIGSKMRDYIKTFVPHFQMKTTGVQIIAEGNYLVPGSVNQDGEIIEKNEYHESSVSPGSVASLLSNTASSFTALSKKLVSTKSSLTPEELSDSATVYSNLINESALKGFFEKNILSGASFTDVSDAGGNYKVAKFDNGNDFYGILVDNENSATYKTGSGKGVIIATGKVEITGDWEGLIISKKLVSVVKGSRTNPVKAHANKLITGQVLRMSCKTNDADGVISFLNFFKGGENYSLSENGDSNFDYADIRNCIGYINWKK